MSKTVKAILIIAGILIVACTCSSAALATTGLVSLRKLVRWADRTASEDAQKVGQLTSEIADIQLPEGYRNPYSVHIGELTSIGYISPSGNSHLYLIQLPQGTHTDVNEMLRMLEQDGRSQRPWLGAEMTTVEQKPVTVRGQDATLTNSEGTSSNGETFHAATLTFQGKGGPAILVVAGPTDEWNADEESWGVVAPYMGATTPQTPLFGQPVLDTAQAST